VVLDLVYAAVAVAVVLLFVLFVRRAAQKNLREAGRPKELAEPRAARAKSRERAKGKEEEEGAERPKIAVKRKGQKPKATAEPEPEAEEPEAEELEAEEPEAEEHEAEEHEAEAHEADEKLRAGLAKTRGGFVARIGKLFAKKKIDEDVLGELEEVLFTADIGPKAAEKLFSSVKSELSKADLEDGDKIWNKLREKSRKILEVEAEPLDFDRERPFVLVTIGVNGVGKTTTIGKLAAKLTRQGKKVLLAAGDTFRAAAVEQLEVWGERSGCPVVKGASGADPSSVIFDAIKRGQAEDFDVVIADTAGRLHTKVDLMDELAKVGRVIQKAQEGAPHEVFLVLDSTTGQNALQQAEIFKNAMNITGIVLTKLDGTAKGGVILGIADEMQVPVRFIGIGEQVDDLREFDAGAFVDALYEQGTADAA